MRRSWWIAVAWIGLACAALGAERLLVNDPAILAVAAWTPSSPADDTLATAQAALQKAPVNIAGPFEFHAPPEKAAWYALDLVVAGEPALLELTHPLVRSAQLYLPGAREPQAAGRDVPGALHRSTRLPAAFELPASSRPVRVYLRVWGTVPMRGQFSLQPAGAARSLGQLQLLAMGVCFALAALASVYSIWRAVRVRSAAWALYGAVGLLAPASAILLLGYGESWLWPALSPWRGPATAFSACLASALGLLLSERVFAMDVQTPRFARVLRNTGIACALAALAGLAMPMSVYQAMSQVCTVTAVLFGLASLLLALRTHNRPAAWLLAGFAPPVAAIGTTTLALAGVIAFEPWVLMAMPLGSVLKLPFNFFGLFFLERRQQRLRQSLAEALQGAAEGESRRALAQRLSRWPQQSGAGSLLIIVRLDALAPGSPILGRLDAEAVERFMHMLMKSAIRPGIQLGRWSHHQLALRGPLRLRHADVDTLATQLFVRADALTQLGLTSRQAQLRIAIGRLPGSHALEPALAELEKLLDDPHYADRARLEWNYTQRCVTHNASV